MQRAHRVVPVELDVAHLGAGRHHVFDLAGDLAHLLRVGADDAELHREADRRAELEAGDAHPRVREFLVRRSPSGASAPARAPAMSFVMTMNCGVPRVRQLRIEREIEARLSLRRCRR